MNAKEYQNNRVVVSFVLILHAQCKQVMFSCMSNVLINCLDSDYVSLWRTAITSERMVFWSTVSRSIDVIDTALLLFQMWTNAARTTVVATHMQTVPIQTAASSANAKLASLETDSFAQAWNFFTDLCHQFNRIWFPIGENAALHLQMKLFDRA